MPTLNMDNLGSVGMFPDLPETEIPPNGFTMVNNVRYEGEAVIRSGVFRQLPVDLDGSPAMTGIPLKLERPRVGQGTDELLYVATDTGNFYSTEGATLTDASPAGHVPAANPARWSSDSLAALPYFASPARPVYGLDPTAGQFVEVMAGTPHAGGLWAVVRGHKSRLMVANGVEGLVAYPQRVQWSDPVENSALATGWDTAALDTTAGWVDLADFRGGILDMMPMGDNMYIYGTDGVSRMWEIPSELIYANTPALRDRGVLSTGCVANIPQLGHFVVGGDTIYIFDGHQARDIAIDRVEQTFRQTLVPGKEQMTYVYVDYPRNEAWVCYVSNDAGAEFPTTDYPNRALVWDYRANAWSIRDIPNVPDVATFTYYPDAPTWESLETENILWSTAGGSWAMAAGKGFTYPALISAPTTDASFPDSLLMVHDQFGHGAGVLGAPRTAQESFVERTGIAVKALGLDLWTTKYVDQVAPINDVVPGEMIQISLAGSNSPAYNYRWVDLPPFDGAVTTWLNARVMGRYLGYRVSASGDNQMRFTRMDVRVNQIAQR